MFEFGSEPEGVWSVTDWIKQREDEETEGGAARLSARPRAAAAAR